MLTRRHTDHDRDRAALRLDDDAHRDEARPAARAAGSLGDGDVHVRLEAGLTGLRGRGEPQDGEDDEGCEALAHARNRTTSLGCLSTPEAQEPRRGKLRGSCYKSVWVLALADQVASSPGYQPRSLTRPCGLLRCTRVLPLRRLAQTRRSLLRFRGPESNQPAQKEP